MNSCYYLCEDEHALMNLRNRRNTKVRDLHLGTPNVATCTFDVVLSDYKSSRLRSRFSHPHFVGRKDRRIFQKQTDPRISGIVSRFQCLDRNARHAPSDEQFATTLSASGAACPSSDRQFANIFVAPLAPCPRSDGHFATKQL